MSESRTKALFCRALEQPESVRQDFVSRTCGADAALARRVLDLLDAHGAASDFMEAPATAGLVLASFEVPTERPGDRIGPYELVEPIGEGGFSIVWRAAQFAPVRRDVALKVVKLGMDTVEVIARFEHERDALAAMDHPHVAKIVDGGATADGRPWFAMELVDGTAITTYCDREMLTTRERLQLFANVCRAIQHGHHKGIVHRDVKPSNVLVSSSDGRPLPKVIDFGIAKALDGSETGRTDLRTHDRLLGTPQYMSPEQIVASGDVDARTDVYSLGVLLYELVTGTRPFDARGGPQHELLARIGECDPEKPSTRIGRLPPEAALAAERARRATRRDLQRQIRGDVDWIVLRALEKDRDRRYQTAAQLAADVERSLRFEPVVAGPPGLGYRLRRFARRHRAGVALGLVATVSLVGGTAFAIDGMLAARRAASRERAASDDARRSAAAARDEASRARLALDQLEGLLFAVDPRAAHGPDFRAREMLDEFAERLRAQAPSDPTVAARIDAFLGNTYRGLGDLKAAEQHLRRALTARERSLATDDPDLLASRRDLARLHLDLGRPDEATAILGEVVAALRRCAEPLELAAALDSQAEGLSQIREHESARAAATEALDICRSELGDAHLDTARCRARLLLVDVRRGVARDAIARFEETLATLGALLPDHHPELSGLRQNLGAVLESAGKSEEAVAAYRLALAGRRRVHGPDHPATARTCMALGSLLHRLGQRDEGVELMEAGVASLRVALGPGHRSLGRALARLGDGLRAQGRTEQAIGVLERAVANLSAQATPVDDELAGALSNLGLALWSDGRRDVAMHEIGRALSLLPPDRPESRETRTFVLANLGRMRHEMGDYAGAVEALEDAVETAGQLWTEGNPQRRLVERYLQEARAAARD